MCFKLGCVIKSCSVENMAPGLFPVKFTINVAIHLKVFPFLVKMKLSLTHEKCQISDKNPCLLEHL